MTINVRVLNPAASQVEGTAGDDLTLFGTFDFNGNGTIEQPDEGGLLLTGEIIEMGYLNVGPGQALPMVDFRFEVTGGLMASMFPNNIGVWVEVPGSTWPAGVPYLTDWANSFQGGAYGIVNPLPCGGSIGDIVWNDENHNGIQDPGEPGLDGVTVHLRDQSGNILRTTVTGPGPMNQHGYYQFKTCAGSYSVEVDMATVPAGFVPTAANAPIGTSTTDSNVNPSATTLATDFATDRTIDFGFGSACAGTIGSLVWHDENGNGVQDGDEPGLDGVTVNLRDPAGNILLATTTTHADGTYELTGLCAGAYLVELDPATVPAGFSATAAYAGGDAEDDSNPSPARVTLAANNSPDEDVEFGYVSQCDGLLGDFIWFDKNRNGIQNANEPGIEGVIVNLRHRVTDALVATTTTDSDGHYQFSGLCGGNFKVEVDAASLPADRSPAPSSVRGSTRSNDSNRSPAMATLAGYGASNQTIDFGFIAPCGGTIGDLVWQDENRNGIQDNGEDGYAGVKVNLRRASDNAVIQTDTTDEDGAYLFEGLCPGRYIVEVSPRRSMIASPAGRGSNRHKDSNANRTLVRLSVSSDDDLSIDFGYHTKAGGPRPRKRWCREHHKCRHHHRNHDSRCHKRR